METNNAYLNSFEQFIKELTGFSESPQTLEIPSTPTIRASQCWKLFVDARKKGELSETTKDLAISTIANAIGLASEVASVYLEKGVTLEEQAIELYNSFASKNYIKNEVIFRSPELSGTPDIIDEESEEVIDIKTSFSFESHLKNIIQAQNEVKREYYYQLQAYMLLTGKRAAKLIYVLLPTPDDILQRQARALEFKGNSYDEVLEGLKKQNSLIEKLPLSLRVKEFQVVSDNEFKTNFFERYEKFKEYYQTLIEIIKN